jgi:putative ABC transport system permease protein
LTLVVRTSGDPATLTASIKSVARSVDPGVPISEIRTLDDVLSASLAEPRTYTWALGIFAALALTLAAVGLYGVVGYSVTQRAQEIGIRLALGAERGDVLRMVLRQGLILTLIGSVIGLAGAGVIVRLLTRLSPFVEPGEPWTLAATTAVLMAVALVASYVPARRGSALDPAVVLRAE